MNELKKLVNRQNEELKALIPNEETQSIIRQLLIICLFKGLTSNELRLFIKFMIESVDASEKITKEMLL